VAPGVLRVDLRAEGGQEVEGRDSGLFDGRDAAGGALPTGPYYVRLTADSLVRTIAVSGRDPVAR
jgi:hypothetical protein